MLILDDSYIAKNLFHFGIHDLDLEGLNPWYFEEDNGHPFDFLIKAILYQYIYYI